MERDENDVTLATYDERVEAYLARSQGEPCRPLLALLREAVPPPARVLEIGSGPGSDAAQLAADGYSVQASDASAGFLAHLRATGHQAIRYDVDHDDAPDGAWDAIYASAVLHHLRRDRFEPALARLGQAVQPGGVLVASLKTGRADGWSHAKLDAPRWFTYWSAAELRDVLERAGWHVDRLAPRAGRNDDWLDVVARAPKTPVGSA